MTGAVVPPDFRFFVVLRASHGVAQISMLKKNNNKYLDDILRSVHFG